MTRPLPPLTLGDLEMEVLEQLWRLGSGDVRAVHAAQDRGRDNQPNTVQSALERLFRKGLLDREKQGHAYIYRPRLNREELAARLIDETLGRMNPARPLPLLAAFVDLSLQNEDLGALEALERLVAERRAQLQSGLRRESR
ncbi:MAG: BlaI/MecI/CopY family transcriptional regulator [Geothrix sp.]|nr:BlaI/MecI/CopY family transcriptional regulator [Geothrix sp.]